MTMKVGAGYYTPKYRALVQVTKPNEESQPSPLIYHMQCDMRMHARGRREGNFLFFRPWINVGKERKDGSFPSFLAAPEDKFNSISRRMARKARQDGARVAGSIQSGA